MAYTNKDGKLIFNTITSNVVVQANYLADRQDKHHIDDLIDIYTGFMPWNYGTPQCSHTEIGVFVDSELWFFSSTSRKELGVTSKKKNGTRWVPAKELLRNPERWLIQEKRVLYDPILIITQKINRANMSIGMTYDFYGVVADFVNPARILFSKQLNYKTSKRIKKIYCSKAVHAVDTGKINVMSPKRRFKWACINGYETLPNTIAWANKHGIV